MKTNLSAFLFVAQLLQVSFGQNCRARCSDVLYIGSAWGVSCRGLDVSYYTNNKLLFLGI